MNPPITLAQRFARRSATLRAVLPMAAFLALAPPAAGQEPTASADSASAAPTFQEPTPGVLTVPVGNSEVVSKPGLDQVSIGDPEIADAVVVSPREVVVNGKMPGTTTLFVWDASGSRTRYRVRVVADAREVEEQVRALFPGQDIRARAAGNTVVLHGTATEPRAARRAVELARNLGEGVHVVDEIQVPKPSQVLLRVRFAEINRSALKELGMNVLRVDPLDVRGDDEGSLQTGGPGGVGGTFLGADGPEQTFSDAVNLFMFHDASNVSLFIRALQNEGLLRTLAEPNLLVMSGDSASFLAGGEFPFPVVQGGASLSSVTIQFKEFGIRLRFAPIITPTGSIRLRVAPEVSTLDFANGLQVSGFQVPALLSRRAETAIELEDGQTFAIAGLLDHSLSKSVSKIPLLGDIPILGALFRSEEVRENRSELLVLVTPELVNPLDRSPPLPTGEPETWDWGGHMRPEETGPDADEAGSRDAGGR